MTQEIQVTLRELRPADASALVALAADPEAAAWNPVPGEDLEDWITKQNEDADDFRTWAVASADDDRLLGTVSAFHIDQEQGVAEIGYRVVPSERGRGVATAALTAAATRLFAELDLRRLQLFHAVGNAASCTVAERAGFRLEGTLRQSYVYGDGRPHDEHLHARLATDPAP